MKYRKWPRVTRACVQAYARMCVSVCVSDHVNRGTGRERERQTEEEEGERKKMRKRK